MEPEMEIRFALDDFHNTAQFHEPFALPKPSIWSRVKEMARELAMSEHVEPPWVFAVHNFSDSALQLYFIEWFWRYYSKRIGLRYKPVPFWFKHFNVVRKPRGVKQAARAVRDAKICEFYRRGLSTWKIANALGLSPSTVYQIIRRVCRD